MNGVPLALIGTAVGRVTSFCLLNLLGKMLLLLPGTGPLVVVAVAALLVVIAYIASCLPGTLYREERSR